MIQAMKHDEKQSIAVNSFPKRQQAQAEMEN